MKERVKIRLDIVLPADDRPKTLVCALCGDEKDYWSFGFGERRRHAVCWRCIHQTSRLGRVYLSVPRMSFADRMSIENATYAVKLLEREIAITRGRRGNRPAL